MHYQNEDPCKAEQITGSIWALPSIKIYVNLVSMMPGGYHGRAFCFLKCLTNSEGKNALGKVPSDYTMKISTSLWLNHIIQMKNEFIVVHQMQYKFLLNQIIEMKNEFIAVHQRLGEIVSA